MRKFGQRRKVKVMGEVNDVDDEIVEEAAAAKTLPDVCRPCLADVNLHNLTHLPFRDWCPYCVQGKAVTHPHVN